MRTILAIVAALGAAALVAATAQAHTTHARASGALVTLRKTALGSVLVDARGRTLYLFEKDHNGQSMCNTACVAYWPPLVSHNAPRAGTGVTQSLLTLGRAHNGVRQVLYSGHPLYTFVGDKSAGQTAGEGLNNFGAEWYALAASGRKVEPSKSSDGSSNNAGSSGYGSSGGYSSSGGY
jgi:predicted lipoprotein with Yx(FWY)xxD motif